MSIIVKSGVPGKAPTSAQLDYGQLALNYADQKIYFKNSSNQVVEFPVRNTRVPLLDSNKSRVVLPLNGSYTTTAPSVTGAICITLPSFSSTMISLRVNIYKYLTGESYTIILHGYTFAGSQTWIATSANILSPIVEQNKVIVRFGKNTSNQPVIYIGEVGSVWNYPQVHIESICHGYSLTGVSETDSYPISFVTAFDTVQTTHDLTNQKLAYIGTFFAGRANLQLTPTVSNTTNWYRLASFSNSNASCFTRFIFHWGHTTYEVTLSNGAGGDNCLLEVTLRGNYTYYNMYPADWRLVTSGTNLATHVDVRFPHIGASEPSFTLHVNEQFTQVANQITYPGTNLGTVETSNWHGLRMSSGSAITYGKIKIRPGYYQREAYPGFAITTGTITNQTVVT